MNFPTIQVNNFFDNIDTILDFSKNQNFDYDKLGYYPGQRTKCISELDFDLFVYINSKIFRLFYPDYNTFNSVEWKALTYFQKIKYEDIDLYARNNGRGWIHKDHFSLLTSIVYLTPNDLSSGTSIYKSKKEGLNMISKEQDIKRDYHKRQIVDKKSYYKLLNENHSYYDEVSHFKSNFNSLIAFDSAQPHSANYNIQPGEERLTLITFLNYLKVPYFPIPEMNKI